MNVTPKVVTRWAAIWNRLTFGRWKPRGEVRFRSYTGEDGELHASVWFHPSVSQADRDTWCLYISGEHPDCDQNGTKVQLHIEEGW